MMNSNIPYPDSDIPIHTQKFVEWLKSFQNSSVGGIGKIEIQTDFGPKRIKVLNTVFPPGQNEFSISSQMIFDNLKNLEGKKVGEIGVGSGVNLVIAGLNGANRVIGCDINVEAVKTSNMNLIEHDIQGEIVLSDGTNLLEGEELYILVCNFPILDCDFSMVSIEDITYYQALCDTDFALHKEVFSKLGRIIKEDGYLLFCHANLKSSEQAPQQPLDDFKIMEDLISNYSLKVQGIIERYEFGIIWRTYKIGL